MTLQTLTFVAPATPNVVRQLNPTTDSVQTGKWQAPGIAGVSYDAMGALVSNLAAAVSAGDAVNLAVLQAAVAQLQTLIANTVAGLSPKGSVVVLLDAQTTLSGLPTVQGVTLTNGQRVAVTANTNAVENGLYNVSSGAWARTADLPAGDKSAGIYFFVQEGTYVGQQWWCTTAPGSDVAGTNPLSFSIGFASPSGLGVNGTALNYAGGKISLVNGKGNNQGSDGLDVLVDGNAVQVNGSNQVALVLAPNGPFSASNTGLAVTVDPTTFAQAGGLSLVGLPATANLNLLYQGNNADVVHKHSRLRLPITNGATAAAVGAPGYINSQGQAVASDAASLNTATVIGFYAAATAANAAGDFITHGVVPGVLSGATPGAYVYLAVGGGLTTTPPSSSGQVVVPVGYALNATDLFARVGSAVVRS